MKKITIIGGPANAAKQKTEKAVDMGLIPFEVPMEQLDAEVDRLIKEPGNGFYCIIIPEVFEVVVAHDVELIDIINIKERPGFIKRFIKKTAKTIMPPLEDALRPDYYGGKDNVYEAIKVIDAWGLGFNLGNAAKYISRAGKKHSNSIEDLQKAKTYIEFEINKRKKQNDQL